MLDRKEVKVRKPSHQSFKDNEDGARSALKLMLDKTLWKHLEISEVKNIKRSKGVWKIEGMIDGHAVEYIIYLNLPFGVDMEEVY